MPRANKAYMGAAVKEVVAPIILLRILNIPHLTDGTKESLYLTDYIERTEDGEIHKSVEFFDEDWYPQTYYAANISYTPVEVSTDNTVSSVTITLDNVPRDFSALAQYYELNGVMVHLLSATRDTLSTPEGAVMKFAGKIREIKISEYAISFEIRIGYTLADLAPKKMYHVSDFPYIPSAKDPRSIFRK